MTYQLSKKDFYAEPLTKTKSIPEEFVKEAYLVFACRHKFCRDICPNFDLTRREAHTSYGFHTSILAVSRGVGDLDRLVDDFTYCLECGACELRCPNTSMGGDFYRRSTTTVDLVRKVRRDHMADGGEIGNWSAVKDYLDEHRGFVAGQGELVTRWAEGIKLAGDMKTALFVDFFTASQGTEVPRLAAQILGKLGVRFGVYTTPGVTAPELLSQDEEEWKKYAAANVASFRELGVKTLVVVNPHDYALFIREYPKWFDMDGIETVFVTDFVLRTMKERGFTPALGVEGKFAYHDPCTLNKLVVEADSPRELVAMIPGAEIIDVPPGNQWRYCCGNGNGPYRKLHEDVAYRIGQKRLRAAADLGADTILVACPHCKDQFTDVKAKAGLPVEPVHVFEILAKAMGIDWQTTSPTIG
ncbi:MAG TPA: (Fe-S)-binding protein [Thermoleophilia bacterium]|nr:(Fe-S)-binding protein [Thermoleophilia bacterium]